MPPPLLAFACVIVLALQSVFVPSLSVNLFLQELLGGGLIGFGLMISITSARAFRRNGTTIKPDEMNDTVELISSGLFSISRNPMYLGLAVVIIGIGLFTGAILLFIILPLFIWVVTVSQIIPEERALLNLFGEMYLSYKTKVRRWI